MTERLPLRGRAIGLLSLGKLMLGAIPVLAQGLSFDVGPIAGVASASWRGADVPDPTRFRTSFVAGGSVNISFNKFFALEAQVLHVRKGTEFIIPPCGFACSSPPTEDYTQDYVEVPLLFKATYPIAGRMRFAPTIFAGPGVAFQTSCIFSSPGPIKRATCDSLYAPFGTSMRNTDALLIFGGGFSVGPVALLGRYDLGLTKLIVQGSRNDIKSEAWLMTAGVRLRLGKL